MMLKWITCRTAPETREPFAQAQRAWEAIARVPGFLGQFGGFAGDDAQILGLWRDDAAYRSFMRSEHDRVAETNRQSRFYRSIEVRLWTQRFRMPGSEPELALALAEARYLRMADCTVREGRVDRFVAAQREIWLPGMADVPGMLAGELWSFQGQGRRFLVTSLWSGERDHSDYMGQRLPALRARARTADDLVALEGFGLRLLPEWMVLPLPRGLC